VFSIILVRILLAPTAAAAPRRPPVTDVDPGQDVLIDDVTNLDGNAFDPDGNDIVPWTWTIESAPVGSDR
jgi:hypothetical protein